MVMSETGKMEQARIAPAAEGPSLTEQLNFLVTPETRAFLLGSRVLDNARSEGVVARQLLEMSIAGFRAAHGQEAYDQRVSAGVDELRRRAT